MNKDKQDTIVGLISCAAIMIVALVVFSIAGGL